MKHNYKNMESGISVLTTCSGVVILKCICMACHSKDITLNTNLGLGKLQLSSEGCRRPCEDEKCISVVRNPRSPKGAEAMNHRKEINQCSCVSEVSSLFSFCSPTQTDHF